MSREHISLAAEVAFHPANLENNAVGGNVMENEF